MNTADELVHLARLALIGRPQDVQMYLRRLARRYRSTLPELSEQLGSLLRELPTRQNPMRTVASDAIPVDVDSRLQLLRHEYPVELDVDPIWSSVIRQRLEQIVYERKKEEDLSRAGLVPSSSVLLTGPPGVGKSLAARWLACELNRPLFILDLSAVMSSFLGRTGSNVRQVLDYAKSIECVLLLDELDAVAKRRDDVSEIGELKRLVTVLLQEIDDWPPSGLLVAATNHPDLLDPAVWRRFDITVEFTMPTDVQAEKAVMTFLGAAPPEAQSLNKVIAVALRGLSFNDIERELFRVRREAIVYQQPLETRLKELIRTRLDLLSRDNRTSLAVELVHAGHSQREVQEITGVSRDTIRKYRRATN